MIPLVALKAVPWRLIGYGLALGAFVLLFWRINVWHTAYGELRATQERLELEESCADGSKCRAREARLREEVEGEKAKVVEGLAAELAAVGNRPPRVIRLCPDRTGLSVSSPAAGGDAGTPGTGELSGPAGRDIGGDVYGLAREADEIVAKCRQLQNWNKALSGSR